MSKTRLWTGQKRQVIAPLQRRRLDSIAAEHNSTIGPINGVGSEDRTSQRFIVEVYFHED